MLVVPTPLPHPTAVASPDFLAQYADELRTRVEALQQLSSPERALKPAPSQTHPIPGGASAHHSSPDLYTTPSQQQPFISHSQHSSVSTSSTETLRPSFDRERFAMKNDIDAEGSGSRSDEHVETVKILPVPASLPTVCLQPFNHDQSEPQYGPLTREQHLSLQSLTLTDIENMDSLSDLDLRDDRTDPDSAVSRRLTRSEILRRISALSAASSLWSPSLYDPVRASVQTYGSSVLTYGSRASQYLGEDDADTEHERPSAPLPWVPRPSALNRIQLEGQHRGRARSGSGSSSSSRPLPPVPNRTSSTFSRDRSVSAPDLVRSDSNSSSSTYSLSSVGSIRRLPRPLPRPLPRTPQSMASQLPDISEGEVTPSRTNSMFLSPTESEAPFESGRAKSARLRYSTMGYGQAARSMKSARNLFDNAENPGGKKKSLHSRSASCLSTRSARSVYFVPDVDELVRILDSMDDGSSPSSGSSADEAPVTPTAGSRFPSGLKEDAGEKKGAVWSRNHSKGDAASVELIGLPTPAATPRSSPQRQPSNLPKPSSEKKSNAELTISVSREVCEPSPVPTSAGGLSLANFPLPPPALRIMAPEAVGADDIPIPSASASVSEPSPSMGKSFAEQATLPGMELFLKSWENRTPTPPRTTRTLDAIKDLKQRVSILPGVAIPSSPPKNPIGKYGPVPILSQPVPPRRRTQSNAASSSTSMGKKPVRIPQIDTKAANACPPAGFNYTVGKQSNASSAPALAKAFDEQTPQIIYTTPAPVAPLRIRRTSSCTNGTTGKQAISVNVPPMASVPQSASAMQTTFPSSSSSKGVPLPTRPQRAASFCVSPSGPTTPSVAPLRLRPGKSGNRARSSTLGSSPLSRQISLSSDDSKTINEEPEPKTSVEVNADEGYESDLLKTPTNAEMPGTPIARVAEPEHEEGTGTGVSMLTVDAAMNALQLDESNATLDPAFADIIKSIAGASEEEQMGSLLTIASSIHTDHHTSGYNAGFTFPFVIDGEKDEDHVDVDDEPSMTRAANRKSTASISDRRRSRGRSTISMKRRQSTRSAAAVRAAIRALPDPSTFPIPASAGSTATDSSAGASANDFASFVRPSPLPKLRVVTKFKGNTVLLPASQAPLSAVSTKSSMSMASSHMGMGGHSRSGSTIGHGSGSEGRISKRTSVVGGPRKMNRLTLTDPRSPMADAALAAAALVARVRQKRAALSQRGTLPSNGSNSRQNAQRALGHQRTNSGSSGTLRSKLKMSSSGFFGSNVRSTTEHDTVMRSGPKAHRPTLRIPRARRDAAAASFNGDVIDLCS